MERERELELERELERERERELERERERERIRIRVRVRVRVGGVECVMPGGRTRAAGATTQGDIRWGAGIPPAPWGEGMTHSTPPTLHSFPHHRLIAYQLALSLVKLVVDTRIADAQLRQQARRSATSAALNCAEGAARQTQADKSRVFAIALAECCECCAAIEIAAALGACSAADEQAALALGVRLKNVLSRLVH